MQQKSFLYVALNGNSVYHRKYIVINVYCKSIWYNVSIRTDQVETSTWKYFRFRNLHADMHLTTLVFQGEQPRGPRSSLPQGSRGRWIHWGTSIRICIECKLMAVTMYPIHRFLLRKDGAIILTSLNTIYEQTWCKELCRFVLLQVYYPLKCKYLSTKNFN